MTRSIALAIFAAGLLLGASIARADHLQGILLPPGTPAPAEGELYPAGPKLDALVQRLLEADAMQAQIASLEATVRALEAQLDEFRARRDLSEAQRLEYEALLKVYSQHLEVYRDAIKTYKQSLDTMKEQVALMAEVNKAYADQVKSLKGQTWLERVLGVLAIIGIALLAL